MRPYITRRIAMPLRLKSTIRAATRPRTGESLPVKPEAPPPKGGVTSLYDRLARGQPVAEQVFAAMAERRLPMTALGELRAVGFAATEIAELVVSPRTMRHRKKMRRTFLSMGESERALRLARVQALAEQTFGNPAKAHAWLRRPLTALYCRAPLSFTATEFGARLVENLLARIAWGAAA